MTTTAWRYAFLLPSLSFLAVSAMTVAQLTAFQANGCFPPSALATALVGLVFALVLLWGVWAIRTAYTGWAANRLSSSQSLGALVRVATMYVVLSFFLLS